MNKPTAYLNNWSVRHLAGEPRLVGRVAGHPDVADGDEVTTSVVLSIDFGSGRAETRNTIYMLGPPAELYRARNAPLPVRFEVDIADARDLKPPEPFMEEYSNALAEACKYQLAPLTSLSGMGIVLVEELRFVLSRKQLDRLAFLALSTTRMAVIAERALKSLPKPVALAICQCDKCVAERAQAQQPTQH